MRGIRVTKGWPAFVFFFGLGGHYLEAHAQQQQQQNTNRGGHLVALKEIAKWSHIVRRETSEIRALSVDVLKLLPCTVVLECTDAVQNIQQEKLKEKYKSLRLFCKLLSALELSVSLINLIKKKHSTVRHRFRHFCLAISLLTLPHGQRLRLHLD